jgi:hypothetical protein
VLAQDEAGVGEPQLQLGSRVADPQEDLAPAGLAQRVEQILDLLVEVDRLAAAVGRDVPHADFLGEPVALRHEDGDGLAAAYVALDDAVAYRV